MNRRGARFVLAVSLVCCEGCTSTAIITMDELASRDRKDWVLVVTRPGKSIRVLNYTIKNDTLFGTRLETTDSLRARVAIPLTQISHLAAEEIDVGQTALAVTLSFILLLGFVVMSGGLFHQGDGIE